MTIADVAVVMALDFFASAKIMTDGFSDIHEDMLKSMSACTALTKLHRRVKAYPGIAAYLKRRPDYPF